MTITAAAPSVAPSKGLRESEQSWLGAFERLLNRFPDAGADRVARALRDARGHAGRAAAVLRAAIAQQEGSPRPMPARGEPRTRTGQHRDCDDEDTAQEARSRFRASAPENAQVSAGRAAYQHAEAACAGNKQQRNEVLEVEALAREGRRLRHKLDSVLAEARAERVRADSLAVGQQVAAAASTAKSRFSSTPIGMEKCSQASQVISQSELLMELHASQDEGRRLRRELEDALEAAKAGAEITCERERLRKELDAVLEESAAPNSATSRKRQLGSPPQVVEKEWAPQEPAMALPPESGPKVADPEVTVRKAWHSPYETRCHETPSLGARPEVPEWWRARVQRRF